jgi:hypothetical protein
MLTRRLTSAHITLILLVSVIGVLTTTVRGFGAETKLSLEQVKELVAEHFRSQPGYRPGDIISQSDVEAVLRHLATYGFRPEDSQEIIADTLADSNSLVTLMRTSRGRKYMAKVSDFTLIYDRLDRVSRVSSGVTTLDMLVRLPNGEKFSHPKSQLPHGVPDILDLMPKKGNGLVRSIKDYGKPTGRIYSEADLVKRLGRSIESGQKVAKP